MISKYKKYKFLKNELSNYSLNGYPFERVLGSYLARMIWSSFFQKIQLFMYMFFISYSIKNPSKVLLTLPSKRKSYKRLIDNFLLKNELSVECISRINIKPRNIFKTFRFMRILFKDFTYIRNIGFFDNFLVSFLRAYAVITIEELEKNNFNVNKYIAFNSSYFYESFLSFYFKKRNVPTSSLQHGIYYQYQNDIPFETINYENTCADELLCWSDFTIDQIQSYIPSDVSLKKDIYPYASNTSIYKNSLNIDQILVMLPRIKYKKEMKTLLELLKKTNGNYLIRPHPSSKRFISKLIKRYDRFQLDAREHLSDTLKAGNYEFCIGFNTTSSFEAVFYGHKVCQFICGNDEFFLDFLPSFSSLETFKSLSFKNNNNNNSNLDYYLNPDEDFKIISKKLIVISGINLRSSGTLAILEDVLSYANKSLHKEYKIVALVHSKELFKDKSFDNIEFLEFPKSINSYFIRFYLEYFYFNQFSKNMNPYLWLSLQDLSANVKSKITAVYCHNATSFYKVSLKEALYDTWFLIQNFLYNYFYSINIKQNDYIVVQQNWIRDNFNKIFKVDKDKIIVSYPQNQDPKENKMDVNKNAEFTFFYPSFPRVFKNFEIILDAIEILNKKDLGKKYKVILTIDGSENRYTKDLLKKYHNLNNVDFIGVVERSKVYEIYKKSNCLIFPSKLETWGLPVSEAKEFNLPILISDLPYAHETVNNYDKALFFDPFNKNDLAKKMTFAINNKFNRHEIIKPDQPFSEDWKELFDILLQRNS